MAFLRLYSAYHQIYALQIQYMEPSYPRNLQQTNLYGNFLKIHLTLYLTIYFLVNFGIMKSPTFTKKGVINAVIMAIIPIDNNTITITADTIPIIVDKIFLKNVFIMYNF